jgi:hypothetical protein
MCNIVNSADQQKAVIRTPIYCRFAVAVKSKISFHPGNFQTANEYLVKPFARGKAYSFPLQDPIKNVICSPE